MRCALLSVRNAHLLLIDLMVGSCAPCLKRPHFCRLVAICEDIYAARAEGELELEEGLFWTLIKIYRSPHILMEYTKADKVD